MKSQVDLHGFAEIEGFLSPSEVEMLSLALEQVAASDGVRSRGGVFAIRNLLDASPEVRGFADSQRVRSLLEPMLGDKFIPVRGTLFDKIPDANWKVPWHQDVTIAVREKIELECFGPWSTKADVPHVQPPVRILENMISLRVHLDPCGEENGALRVLPGSHLHGRIADENIPSFREKTPEHVCSLGVGGALLMRPLLLHASSPSRVPGHRRVVHIDFAAAELPSGLAWYCQAPHKAA